MKAGLLVNPSSGKNSGKGEKLAGLIGSKILVITLREFAALEHALRKLAAEGVDVLAISSGDGTIQAIQTFIAENPIFPAPPRLMLLPHGTTNMTAADLGVKTRALPALARLLADGETLSRASLRVRPTLRIANPADGRARHGMFTGTGAIWRAVEFCQKAVHGAGLKGEAATFATLALAVGGLMFSGKTPEEERIGRAWPMIVRADGKPMAAGESQLLFLATTLEKLVLASRPFWGGKQGDLRGTVLPFPIPGLWRWLIPALYGSETRTMPQGAASICAAAFEVETPTGWVVDGEFFEAPKGEALRITRGTDFTYVIA